ncbi:MAG: hypothetical protein ACREX8_07370 [Gammaproteobacteria bacterium]
MTLRGRDEHGDRIQATPSGSSPPPIRRGRIAEFLGEAPEIVTPADLGHAIKRAAGDRRSFDASSGLEVARSISVASSIAAFEEALFCEEQQWTEHKGDRVANGRA